MELKKWKKISERVAAENPWWKYMIDEYELPSGRHIDFHYLFDDGGLMIIALTNEGQIPLVRQYRPMVDDFTLEFPAGARDEGEADIDGARRELEEETGLYAKKMELTNSFHPTPGRTKQTARVFIGSDIELRKPKIDDAEEIEVIMVTPEEIDAVIERGEQHNGWFLSGWLLSRKRVYELRDIQQAKR